MNIDKFGRIKSLKSSDSDSSHEIEKLEKMIIVLKNEIIEISNRVNVMYNSIIKDGPITFKIKKDVTHSDPDVVEVTLQNRSG